MEEEMNGAGQKFTASLLLRYQRVRRVQKWSQWDSALLEYRWRPNLCFITELLRPRICIFSVKVQNVSRSEVTWMI